MINIGLENRELEIIKSVFISCPKIKSVKIFGSRAKGNYRKNSDIDLVLIGEISPLEAEEVRISLEELPLPYLFDVKTLSQITNQELINHINRMGVIIYDAK